MDNPDSLSMFATLGVLAVTVVFFVSGKFRTDLIAACSLLALMLLGILAPDEAFVGFSNTIIFTTAGMFILSRAIVRCGLAAIVSNKILGVVGKNVLVLFTVIMILTAFIGSIVSNTGTVAIMMPIVVSMANSIDQSPSRFLMPLAFMSSIGGMFTLIGNSPNMVVNAVYVKAGFPAMTLFSFLPIGIACFLFGMFVISPVTSYYLSRRKFERSDGGSRGVTHKDLVNKYHLAANMYDLRVPAGSELVGKSLQQLCLPEKYGLMVQEVSRNCERHKAFQAKRESISPGPGVVFRAGDRLRVLATEAGVRQLAEVGGVIVEQHYTGNEGRENFRFGSGSICEVVLMSSSRLVGRTVAESNLRAQFGLTVLGLQRGSEYILDGMKDQVMQSGDALLVQGTWDDLKRLRSSTDLNIVVVGAPNPGGGGMVEKIPMVASVLVLMIVVMALNLIPTVVAVMLAAVVLIFGGVFKNMDEVYGSINWETLVLIACLLPMAVAMEKTGVVGIISERMVGLSTEYGPRVALAAIYAVASVMNIFISTTPVALLVAPVALQVALVMGFSPLPFLFATATATSMCFASPFSTPSNALVMSAGRYTFMDYMKLGLPLQFAMGIVMVFVIPWIFPFSG